MLNSVSAEIGFHTYIIQIFVYNWNLLLRLKSEILATYVLNLAKFKYQVNKLTSLDY